MSKKTLIGIVSIVIIALVGVFALRSKALKFRGNVYLVKTKYRDIIKNNGTIDELDISRLKQLAKTHAYKVRSVRFQVFKTRENKFVFPFIFFHEIPLTPSDDFYALLTNCAPKDKKYPFKGTVKYSPFFYKGHFLKSATDNSDNILIDSFGLYKYSAIRPFIKRSFPFPKIYKYMNAYGDLCRMSSCKDAVVPVCKRYRESVVVLTGFASYFKGNTYYLKLFGCFEMPFYKQVIQKINIPYAGFGQSMSISETKSLVKKNMDFNDFKIDSSMVVPSELMKVEFSSKGTPKSVLYIIGEIPFRFKKVKTSDGKWKYTNQAVQNSAETEIYVMILEARKSLY